MVATGSTGIELLAKVNPKIAIATTKQWGRNHRTIGAFFKTTGGKLYITPDSNEAIVATFESQGISIQTYDGDYLINATDAENRTKPLGWLSSTGDDYEKRIWLYMDEETETFLSGWQGIEYNGKNEWFYLEETTYNNHRFGVMVTGWHKINYKNKDGWYYFNEEGVMQSGVQTINGYTYNLAEMTTEDYFLGELINGEKYYLNEDGILLNDLNEPTINSISGNATQWTNENVTLTISATDNESGIAGYSFDDGENWQTSNSKTYTENISEIKIKVKDNAGNITPYEQTIDIDKIDKTAPTITITPNGSNTSQSKEVTITVADVGGSGLSNENSYQYQLGTSETEVPTGTWQDYTNGTEFTIGEGLTGDYYIWVKNISDNAGNEAAESDYIISNKFIFDNSEDADTIAPELSVEYSTTQLTKESVTVTIKSNEEIQEVNGWTISEDDKILTKVYTKNTTENIDVYDIVGNKTTIQVKVENIDTTNPELSVEYDITQPTNKSVTATITANEQLQQLEGWTISEDGTTLTKIFTENTEKNIDVYDLAGNKSTAQVKITNIDKTEIEATVEYSTTILTNKNVTVRIISNKEIKEIDGWTLLEDKKTLTKEYAEKSNEDIKLQDLVGNEREIKISVQNIDKINPKVNVEYSTLKPTNKSLTVTITANEELKSLEGWTLGEDGKTLTKIYTKNTTENIEVHDLAGNKVTAKITISNIDTTLPNIEVKYSTTENTKEDVVVTIVSDEQLQEVNGWTISEDGKTLTKKYEKNVEETIKLYDIAGNELEVQISVKNIDKTTTQKPEVEDKENSDEPDTAPIRIPDAGSNTLIGVIIITFIVAIVLWTKNRKFKDIKL